MKNTAERKGFVYILGVKDIDLPVCKIGMTTRTPFQRCNEINNSSTGDFIWEVAYSVAVDDCIALESLVHKKLFPLRQKGREFFNISVDNANIAIMSIIKNQSDIQLIDAKDLAEAAEAAEVSVKPRHNKKYKQNDATNKNSQYVQLLQQFSVALNVKGRPFGQLNRPFFGISDGVVGIQWNLTVFPLTGEAKLGVNLEGTESTGKWLIAPFLLSNPDISILKNSVLPSSEIHIRLARDAWQCSARLDIQEEFIGGSEFTLDEITSHKWIEMVEEAKGCLNEEKGYKGRNLEQVVTQKSNGQEKLMEVSPHLTIWTSIDMEKNIGQEIESGLATLQPVFDWVSNAAHS